MINLVWLKRDLRWHDHAPLQAAEKHELPYLIIWLAEPMQLNAPDSSERHWQFQYHSVCEMNQTEKLQTVHVMYGEANEIFDWLHKQYNIHCVFSYRESGTQRTFNRDLGLLSNFRKHNIIWKEFQRDGILRGNINREGWDEQWKEMMYAPLIKNTYVKPPAVMPAHPFVLDEKTQVIWKKYSRLFQPAGCLAGQKYLQGFLEQRWINYSRGISKPMQSRLSCSRLSPYLAWGNLTLREVFHAANQKLVQTRASSPLRQFISRLHWHCHFIQKFENECRYETEHINRGYQLISFNKNEELLEAWKQGNTGFPLVDACMRCLHQTGWINFRMRAMLVSFLCHHLLMDWREGVYHLAKLFLDYEPGIHYPQFQMQAGTTGTNLIRIYNPVKNSYSHDSEGAFIKQWIPSLASIPPQFMHEPWKMTAMDKLFTGTLDYPQPIVSPEPDKNRAKIFWDIRKHPLTRSENARILAMHARKEKSRKNP
jgi:deoxyribodipyrimidine photo-lyase